MGLIRCRSPSAPCPPLHETNYQIHRSQSRQRSEPSAEYALSRHGEVRRRSEAEDLGDVADVQAGILCELSRGDHPHQVDHPLEVWRPAPREVAAQMLATY